MNSSPAGIRPIAVIGGTGPAGMGLALRWARAGETVIIGSRDEKRALQAAAAIQQRLGGQARISGMENSAACAASDILMLTVPFEAQASLLKKLKSAITAGSILIDATVPLASGVGGRASRTVGVWQGSAAQQAAELVSEEVSVVAAFHNVSAELLGTDTPLDCDVIVCSDDPDGKDSRRARHRRRKTGKCPHRRADHRLAHRHELPPQRTRRNPHHWPATQRLPLSPHFNE